MLSEESKELIRRMEQQIADKNFPHNPYYPNRFEWVKSMKEKIEYIKRKENGQ